MTYYDVTVEAAIRAAVEAAAKVVPIRKLSWFPSNGKM